MLLLLSSLALSAAPTERDWTVSADPLTTALGYPHLQIERTLGDSWSLYAGPHTRLYDSVLSDEHEPYRGYGLESGVRWFWDEHAPTGGWVMARGVLAGLHTTDGSEQRALGGYGSVLVGSTWVLWDRLVLASGIGVQRLHYSVGGYGADTWFVALHTNIGIAL